MSWTVREVAKLLGVKEVTVYKYVRVKRLESFRDGGKVMIPQKAIYDFLVNDRVGGR